jgi:hypothetical protein
MARVPWLATVSLDHRPLAAQSSTAHDGRRCLEYKVSTSQVNFCSTSTRTIWSARWERNCSSPRVHPSICIALAASDAASGIFILSYSANTKPSEVATSADNSTPSPSRRQSTDTSTEKSQSLNRNDCHHRSGKYALDDVPLDSIIRLSTSHTRVLRNPGSSMAASPSRSLGCLACTNDSILQFFCESVYVFAATPYPFLHESHVFRTNRDMPCRRSVCDRLKFLQ